MQILVIGGGGREHALAWALARSPRRPRLLIAPGNAGTANLGENVAVAADDVEGLLRLAQSRGVDLTVVGPEAPLVEGLVDRFVAAGLRVVGPSAAAARLEGSKRFAKAFMERHGIPTAAFRTFTADAYDEAAAYLDAQGAPVVVKASGLAAGKGAVVCTTLEEAHAALAGMLRDGAFGSASEEVVVEAFMVGEEASVFALCDGTDYVLLPSAQDHKRIGEGDTGPNTGGMGAYAPAPIVTEAVLDRVRRTIIEPTLAGMQAEGHPYSGFLYVGLMLTDEGPKVVEFNCRLGDPETQVVLPLVESDLTEVLARAAEGRLAGLDLQVRDGAAACVVLASGGYPDAYRKGLPIEGLDADHGEGVVVFHAGTRREADGSVVTAGGRVLGVTARAGSLRAALEAAYATARTIEFDGVYYRGDIGQKGLVREEGGGR